MDKSIKISMIASNLFLMGASASGKLDASHMNFVIMNGPQGLQTLCAVAAAALSASLFCDHMAKREQAKVGFKGLGQ